MIVRRKRRLPEPEVYVHAPDHPLYDLLTDVLMTAGSIEQGSGLEVLRAIETRDEERLGGALEELIQQCASIAYLGEQMAQWGGFNWPFESHDD